jgi:hypothetical protein
MFVEVSSGTSPCSASRRRLPPDTIRAILECLGLPSRAQPIALSSGMLVLSP